MKDKKIAVIAGADRLPFLVVESLRAQNFDVFVIGIKNFCAPGLKPDLWVRLGQAGTAVKELRRRGIKRLTFVGAIGHPNLSDIRPDFASIGILARIAKNQKGYDSMLKILIRELEKLGFSVAAAQDLCPDLTFSKGIQTKKKPSKADIPDIERGIEVSRAIGALDIGHSAAVSRQVLAVEAAEGTKKMLERVAEIRRGYKKHGGVLAKMIKPNQDLRIDTTAIGVDTVNQAADARLNGIVVDARHCWAIDREELVGAANRRKIFIIAK
jgi:DUF1009 family protein